MAVSEHSDSRSPIAPAVAVGPHARRSRRCSDTGSARGPSSPPNPFRPFTTAPSTITPPPRPVPTIAEIDVAGSDAEDREVPPQRAGVAVVQIGDRLPELVRQRVADVEAGPVLGARSWSSRAR